LSCCNASDRGATSGQQQGGAGIEKGFGVTGILMQSGNDLRVGGDVLMSGDVVISDTARRIRARTTLVKSPAL
jgi:hypothetical protein